MSGTVGDIVKPPDCWERTVVLIQDPPGTLSQWRDEVEKIRNCAPRADVPKVDSRKSWEEQNREVVEDVWNQTWGAARGWALTSSPFSEYLNPDWPEIFEDLLNHGGRQGNEKWPGGFTWTPRADDFDPKGFFPESSRNGFTQFTNWVPKPTVTPVSAGGSPSGWTFDDIGDWHRWQEWLQSQPSNDLLNVGLKDHNATNPFWGAVQTPIDELKYASDPDSQLEWYGESFRELATVAEDARPPLQRVIESLGTTETKVGDLGATMFEMGPAWQMVNESVNQGTLAYDGLGGSMEQNRNLSFEWGKGLLSDAQAVGYGLPPEMANVGLGISGVNDNYLALQATLLNFRNLPPMPQAIWTWGPGGAGASSSGGSGSATPHVDQDALDEVGLYGTRPDEIPAAIDEARNLAAHGATERERKLAEERLEVLLQQRFELGGVVPGPVGAPMPALLHGGERVLRSGQSGGGPLNVTLHVHGNVVSERELVRNVREGLIRLNREVTEMGF